MLKLESQVRRKCLTTILQMTHNHDATSFNFQYKRRNSSLKITCSFSYKATPEPVKTKTTGVTGVRNELKQTGNRYSGGRRAAIDDNLR